MPHQILLIDDSATVQQLIRLAVADEGFEVIVASDLASAREHLQTRPPEIVLVEISLPDGDGYAFCREIKDTDNTIPVLLIASVQDPLDADRASAAGADGSLTKPFQSISALLETIQNLIFGTAPASDATLIPASSPLLPDPGDILELDEQPFVPPMNPAGQAPGLAITSPLTEAQIEQIADRIAARIEDRLRRDLLAHVIPEVARLVLRRLDENSSPTGANPSRNIDVD